MSYNNNRNFEQHNLISTDSIISQPQTNLVLNDDQAWDLHLRQIRNKNSSALRKKLEVSHAERLKLYNEFNKLEQLKQEIRRQE